MIFQANRFVNNEFDVSQEDRQGENAEEKNVFDKENVEDDICCVKTEIKEEHSVDNEALKIMEYEKNFTPMEVNVTGIKVDEDLPFSYNGIVFNKPENVLSSETQQNSPVRVHNRIILEDVIDFYSQPDKHEGVIVIESGRFTKEETIGECNESKNANAELNQSKSNKEKPTFDFNLQNSGATVLHHVEDMVLHSGQDSIGIMDESEVEEKFNTRSEFIIEDVKTEPGDNLDNGTSFDEKIYRKLLGTSEELCVFLARQDLVKVQKTFKEEQCVRLKRPSYTAKHYPCKSCSFIAIRRFDYLAHIVTNHKNLAIEMNILPVENMFPGQKPRKIWYKCTDCVYITKEKQSLVAHLLTHKQLHEVETFSCVSCPYITKVKQHLIRHVKVVHEKESEIVVTKCPYCYSYFRNKEYMSRHIKFAHKKDKLESFKCNKCPFKTVYKRSLRGHLLTHNKSSRKLYKCPLCPFQTPRKSVLRWSHYLRHTNDEEVRRYHCAHCSFKGKNRGSIIRHLLLHRPPDQVVIHKCDKCSYQTRHKGGLHRHQQVHKNIEELDLVPCPLCPYQGRTKDHLRTHMSKKHPNPKEHLRTHTSIRYSNPKEVQIYSCNFCTYQSRFKRVMERHTLTHMRPEEITFHHCDSCSYKAKTASEVKSHFKIVHEKPPKEHKCDQCGRQFRQRFDLKRHIARHEDSGNNSTGTVKENMLYCLHCSYHTDRKHSLIMHMSIHSNFSSDFFLHCDKCSFQTRHKSSMLRHRKRHKDSGKNSTGTVKENMLNCPHCSYHTKRKYDLKMHMSIHSNFFLPCDKCSFQTRHKSCMLRHKKSQH